MRGKFSGWSILFFLGLGVVVFLFYKGLPYYRLPITERVHDPMHWAWKPGGTIGHMMGIVGSTMMVLMLSYSLRKRWKWLSRFGTLRQWLNVHMFFGIIGPLLVILHSAFRVHGLVALSFWSMIIVALSGVVGRYIYIQIPRTRIGTERSREELQSELNNLLQSLYAERPSNPKTLDEALHKLAHIPNLNRPAAIVLLSLLLRDVIAPFRRRKILREALSEFAPEERKRLVPTLLQVATLERRILMFDRLQEIFHYWHVLHKPFAAVMYLFMIVHVMVALWTGY